MDIYKKQNIKLLIEQIIAEQNGPTFSLKDLEGVGKQGEKIEFVPSDKKEKDKDKDKKTKKKPKTKTKTKPKTVEELLIDVIGQSKQGKFTIIFKFTGKESMHLIYKKGGKKTTFTINKPWEAITIPKKTAAGAIETDENGNAMYISATKNMMKKNGSLGEVRLDVIKDNAERGTLNKKVKRTVTNEETDKK